MNYSKKRIVKYLLYLLIIGALFRVIYIGIFNDMRNALFVSVALIWPIWTTYALAYNKDIVAPFNWENGENQSIRIAYATVSWVGYVAIMLY